MQSTLLNAAGCILLMQLGLWRLRGWRYEIKETFLAHSEKYAQQKNQGEFQMEGRMQTKVFWDSHLSKNEKVDIL